MRLLDDSHKSTIAYNVQEISRIDIPVLIDTTISEDQPYMTLYNPETNADKFYLKYELYNKADDKLLYSSEMVEPGQNLVLIYLMLFKKRVLTTAT